MSKTNLVNLELNKKQWLKYRDRNVHPVMYLHELYLQFQEWQVKRKIIIQFWITGLLFGGPAMQTCFIKHVSHVILTYWPTSIRWYILYNGHGTSSRILSDVPHNCPSVSTRKFLWPSAMRQILHLPGTIALHYCFNSRQWFVKCFDVSENS